MAPPRQPASHRTAAPMQPRRLSIPGRFLRSLLSRHGKAVVNMAGSDAAADLELVNRVRGRTPLLLGAVPALQLLACVRATGNVPGVLAEAGVFETLQDESTAGGPEAAAVRSHFQRLHAREADVRSTLAGYPNVHFHTGVFPQTAAAVADSRFSFVHLDLDLEGSTLAALEFFYPRLAPGALLVADDFSSAPVQAAFHAYFRSRTATIIRLPWSQGIVVAASTGPAFVA